MREAELGPTYEADTGAVIIETLEALGLGALEMPAVLVRSHGPFTWGADVADALANAIALEAVAMMAERTLALDPDTRPIDDALLDRHFGRKHGPGAYYGQAGSSELTGGPATGRCGGADPGGRGLPWHRARLDTDQSGAHRAGHDAARLGHVRLGERARGRGLDLRPDGRLDRPCGLLCRSGRRRPRALRDRPARRSPPWASAG